MSIRTDMPGIFARHFIMRMMPEMLTQRCSQEQRSLSSDRYCHLIQHSPILQLPSQFQVKVCLSLECGAPPPPTYTHGHTHTHTSTIQLPLRVPWGTSLPSSPSLHQFCWASPLHAILSLCAMPRSQISTRLGSHTCIALHGFRMLVSWLHFSLCG